MVDFFSFSIFQAYLVQFFVFYGAGTLFIRLFFSNPKSFSIYYKLFFGLFLLILILSLVHLFIPVNWKITWPLSVFFSIFSLLDIKAENLAKQLTKRFLYTAISHLIIFITLLLILGTSKYENYDSGLYHLQVVRWLSEYPIIPGLGNLHSRLAFNSPWFLVPSFFLPIVKSGFIHYYVISFWYFILLSYFVTKIIIYAIRDLNQFYFYLYFILLLYFLHLPLFIISISPDSIAYCLSIFILTESFYIFMSKRETVISASLILLSGLLVSIKILAILCILPISFSLYTHLARFRFSIESKKVTFLFFLFFGLYCIRGYLMSGYISYPLPFSFGETDWKISEIHRVSEAMEIKAYARHPGPEYLSSLEKPIAKWFRDWNDTFGLHMISNLVKIGLGLCLLYVLSGFKYRNPEYNKFVLFEILMLLGMIFWFFIAPDPRFVQGLLVFFVSFNTALLIFKIFKNLFSGRLMIFLYGLGAYLIINYFCLDLHFPNFPDKIPTITSVSYRVLNGIIYIPESGAEQCWNHELPCAPYKNPKLEFRGSDLSDGFRIRPEK